ncbi:MAG: transglutaminase [Shackletoniella antarctica]|uniref:Transglutaminase n=1 Tax=Shackletoniella antarctica TaxID=268115 RepID=A0A2W4XF01_9CYAN|nr:MAG: transglutaminase [Shackletoniella antarctica]
MVALRWLASSPLARPIPSQEIEDSLLLRVLVQALVTVGICSVVVAAAGVTLASWWNLLAVPASAVGAAFSWQRRRDRNLAVNFFIAVGMLMALAAFFARLIEQPGDTRIVLAELLVQLQVLHSFDLPRRKDLGYSMMIGLILLGVAATISQTLAFAPLLALFLALAVPVLGLEYQSRLGLGAKVWGEIKLRPALGKLAGLLALIVGLGLLIFLFLPRLPGYQLQNFPVSSVIETPDGFSGETINNPAYGSNGSEGEEFGEGGGAIQGQGKATGPGVVDNSAYYGFNQRMNQNLRGTMTPQVVMRVRSQAPGFWRVLAFDTYTGQGWNISRNDDPQRVQRSQFSAQMFLPMEPSLARDREVVQTYTLVSGLPNLIPALYQARQLYFPTREVAIDAEGSLRAPVILQEGMTYSVVSRVPYRDRTQLRAASTIYPPGMRSHYLQVPEDIIEPVRAKTEALLATSPTPLTDPYEKALYLTQTLKQRYTIQPELPFLASDQDLVESFLFSTQGGYPDHFSTVLTVMLRSIDIPARLVAGFGEGDFNPFTGFYVVRNTDAYALTEVYFPQYGWFGFDPIPGHELIPPSLTESETFSLVRRFWNWLAGWLPSPLVGLVEGLINLLSEGLVYLVRRFNALLTLGWVGIMVGIAIAAALGFVAWLAFLGLRRGWRYRRLRQLAPTERLYQQMLTCFAQRGFGKTPAETPLEHSQRLYQQTPPQLARAANEIAHAYVRWRYGGEPQNLTYLSEKLRSIRQYRPHRQRAT